ncbi:MAG: hypothetical protein AMJ73_00265 [candidate division Zixibacteria bacterium SM1_73]|nr:MAG: hypothetical protein AMJ73_00265 [candidate division Zixibacteria bacterium SM1_73]
MRKVSLLSLSLLLLFCFAGLQGQETFVGVQTKNSVKKALLDKYGEVLKFRIEKGVDQAASLWTEEDGTAKEFEDFCRQYFVDSPELLDLNFKRLETNYEILNGNFTKMIIDLKRPLELDWGEILPLDIMFGQFDPSSHLTEDLFRNKVAFFVLLNFPHYSLEEKAELSPKWGRRNWAYSRMGDTFISRVPAHIYQKISQVMTAADTYISEYNIYMGKLVDQKMKAYFPEDLKLISHWGIRDELKSRYSDPEGLVKQKMIYEVMLRIINQDIPEIVINNPDYLWNPFQNMVFKGGEEIETIREPDTRYQHFLQIFKAMKLLDPYYPSLPTHIKRRFEADREIPEKEVEALFMSFISSPQVRKVGKLISRRLGRKLEPFDIWYTGFRSGGSIPEEKLDRIVAERYPTVETFEKDLRNILVKLGFSQDRADFIAPKVTVDASRGIGHAYGTEMKADKSRLRTRVPDKGMNYKGFNIAIHEFGHCVEQTLTLQKVDYYMLRGVPNAAFTEAFAFVFQEKDLDLLGFSSKDPDRKHLKALDDLWNAYEIMGVSLVDMKAWNWLYDHPEATAAELKETVISIAKDIWNTYYADVFGVKDQPILAIYSHMIDAALYLPDYPLGHVIAFQIHQYLEGKNLGEEMERMCVAGNIIPQAWMQNAVGSKVSTQPLLEAVDEALEHVKQ